MIKCLNAAMNKCGNDKMINYLCAKVRQTELRFEFILIRS